MCTVTWEQTPSGYAVYFNRDERNTRPPALPPVVREQHGIKAIMPMDTQAGGTWISVNSRGLTICLINNYGAELLSLNPEAPSRGLLVKALAFCADTDSAQQRFEQQQPEQFNPFDLFVFSPEGRALRLSWDGESRGEITPDDRYAFSAGYDLDAVVTHRRALFHRWVDEGRPLEEYHRSHIPEQGPYSVCMHRAGGGSQSLTIVRVSRQDCQVSYTPGQPCTTSPMPPLTIERDP